jgi:hypothetical protein
MSVEEAVERDLAEIRKVDPDLADSSLAAAALAMARAIDHPDSTTSLSMCAHQHRESMKLLRELAPKKKLGDSIDRLAEQRTKRLGGAASEAV